MTKTKFRYLLLLYLALSAASLLAGQFGDSFSEGLTAAFAQEPNLVEKHPWPSLFVAILFLALTLAGMVGLYKFKLWGRTLSLYTTIAGLLQYVLVGPTLTGAMEHLFSEAGTMLWGALLAIAYYSPLSEQFLSGKRAAADLDAA
jgi:hypothetical protein